jgi:hypothetical protein
MADTAGLLILLTNQTSQDLSLVSSSPPSVHFLPQLPGNSTEGGIGHSRSSTPYQVTWTYSPDGGSTSLVFNCNLNGPNGISIAQAKTGPNAGQWALSEGPQKLDEYTWLVRYYYSAHS